MEYADGLPPVVKRQGYVTNYIQALVFVRTNIDSNITSKSDDDKMLAAQMTENAANKHVMEMFDFEDLLKIKAEFDYQFAAIQFAIAINEIILQEPSVLEKHFIELLHFGEEYLDMGGTPVASILLSAGIRTNNSHGVLEQVVSFVDRLKATDLDAVQQIASSAIDSNLEGVNEEIIQSWLDLFVTNNQNKPGRWDLYQKLALAVVNQRQVAADGSLIKQAIPGIPESEEARLIEDWFTQLDRAGEHALSLELFYAAYHKDVETVKSYGVEGIQDVIEAALGQGGGGFVQVGYGAGTETKGEAEPDLAIEVTASFIERYGERLSPETIFEWNDKITPKVASITNGEGVMVAALRNDALRSKMNSAKLASVVKGGIELAVARKTLAFYVDAARIAAAAVETRFADQYQAKEWLAEFKRYGALSEAEPLLIAMWQGGNNSLELLPFIKDGLAGLIARENHAGALRFAQSMLEQGVPLERDTILDLAGKLGAANPVQAVELCFSAQDAGMDVPEEILQKWLSACYDGKSSEEAVNNAIALVEACRNRPMLRRMDAPGRVALNAEIKQAFEKVWQQKESLGLTASTPYAEAAGKIHAILYPVPS